VNKVSSGELVIWGGRAPKSERTGGGRFSFADFFVSNPLDAVAIQIL
jgi:hypothetical protein